MRLIRVYLEDGILKHIEFDKDNEQLLSEFLMDILRNVEFKIKKGVK